MLQSALWSYLDLLQLFSWQTSEWTSEWAPSGLGRKLQYSGGGLHQTCPLRDLLSPHSARFPLKHLLQSLYHSLTALCHLMNILLLQASKAG